MTVATCALVGIIVGFAVSFALFVHSKGQLHKLGTTDHRYLIERSITPFAALLWIAVACLIHVWISNHLAHQDCGLSGDPYVTLPNGYVVGSLNTYSGYVHAPGVNTDVPFVGPGYVRGLINLTFQNGRFEGTYLDLRSTTNPNGISGVRRFVFDTRDRSIQTFPTGDSADFEGQQNRVHADNTSYWQIYAQYRHHWPTAVLWLLILGGEAAILTLFLRIKPRTVARDLVAE